MKTVDCVEWIPSSEHLLDRRGLLCPRGLNDVVWPTRLTSPQLSGGWKGARECKSLGKGFGRENWRMLEFEYVLPPVFWVLNACDWALDGKCALTK